MPKLQLGAIEVCASELTQRPFRAVPCQLLIPVTPRNKTKALATFKRAGELGEYSGLRVSGVSDLSFLKEFPNLLYLEVVDQKNVNTRHLDGLENLRGLRLHAPAAGLDFACFPHLEVFVGDWHVDNHNVDRSRELRRLWAWHFHPRSRDLSDLANSVRLEQLRIVQTTLASLAGLKTLEDLRYLTIEYAPKLESLDALRDGPPEIRELRFNKAKGIRSYLPIASLGHLRRLQLGTCAPMPDLKWVKGLNELDFFAFVDTPVASNDLSPLLDLPKLQYVGTMNKRAYNYTAEALNELLRRRLESAAPAREGQSPGTAQQGSLSSALHMSVHRQEVKVPIAKVNLESVLYRCWEDGQPPDEALTECREFKRDVTFEEVWAAYAEFDLIWNLPLMRGLREALRQSCRNH